MATKQLYATGTFKYKNRMLKAGDPVEMDGPTARLYEHLNKVSAVRPRAARDRNVLSVNEVPIAKVESGEKVTFPTVKEVLEAKVIEPKAPRRRRKAKKPA